MVDLARTTYQGCNQQHLRDLLHEREGITLSRSSVRRIMEQAGLAPPRSHKRRIHRRRRQRYPQEGMLVQIDGSRHAWLEERGPWLCLIAAIDDAPGTLAAAVFREEEDAAGYFLLVQQMLEQHGRPLALYHDRHGIFQQTIAGDRGRGMSFASWNESVKTTHKDCRLALFPDHLLSDDGMG